MAETNKKKPRKSRLVLRECIDLDDEAHVTLEKLQESSASVPPPETEIVSNEKTNQPTDTFAALQQLKTKMDSEEQQFEEQSSEEPSAVRFSVEIEVEPCEEKEPDKEMSQQYDNEPTCHLNCDLPQKEVVISNGVIKNTTKKLMKLTTSLADKILEIEIHNQWGREMVPIEETELENRLQKVLYDFKMWHFQTKSRGNILAYKCYICRFGWWHLTPFKYHVRTSHENVQFVLDTYLHEASVVAYEGDLDKYSSYIPVRIEGPCWQCQKTFEEHTTLKRNSLFYICGACNDKLPHCKALFDHEGICAKSIKQITKNGETMHESYFSCPVCAVYCLTPARYSNHLLMYHSVRNDVPIGMPLMKQCVPCGRRYYQFPLHACGRRGAPVRCPHCCRRFHSRALADIHQAFTKDDYYCTICNQYLKKHCMAMEHMARHSERYVLMHKCLECVDNVLYPTEELMVRHKTAFHMKKLDRRRINSCYMIVPRECVLHHVNKMDEILADHVAKKQPLQKIVPDSIAPEQLMQKKAVRKYTNKKLVIPLNSDDAGGDRTKDEKASDDDYYKTHCAVNMEKDRKTYASHKTQYHNDHSYHCNKNEDQNDQPDKELIDAVRSLGGSQEADDQLDKEYNKEDEELANAVHFLDRSIKQELEEIEELSQETVYVTKNNDDVVLETEINIKEEKEDNLEVDESTIEDDFEEGYENKLEEVKCEELEEVRFEEVDENKLKEDGELVQNKIETHENGQVHEKTEEIDENKTCIEGLSKVFSVSKRFKDIKVTGFSVLKEAVDIKEEIIIKEESMDEEYEEDSIALNDSGAGLSNLDNSSEIDMKNLEPEVNIDTDGRDDSYDHWARPKRKQRKEYACSKCDFKGVHKEFREHIKVCPGATLRHSTNYWRELPCTLCGTQFNNMPEYLGHFTVHDVTSEACPTCFKTFADIYALQTHFTGHIKMSFLKIQLLSDSTYLTSRASGLFQCRTCPAKVRFGDFFTHWEKHFAANDESKRDGATQAVELPVEMQGEVGGHTLTPEQIQLVIDHVTSPVLSRAAARRCVLCPARSFVRVNDCKRHLVQHLADDAAALRPRYRGLRCQLCGELYHQSERYKLHMRGHAALPLFRCEMCDKTFSDSSNFAKHKKVHNLRVMICDICKKKFHSKAGLTRHLEIHKTTEPSTCSHCDRVFNCPSAYRRHLKQVAMEREPRFRCRVCRVYYRTLRECWDHMWDVHKDRKFKADCPICNKSFRKFQDVRRHVRKAHDRSAVFVRQRNIPHDNIHGGHPTTTTTTTTSIQQDVEEFLSNTDTVRLQDGAEETLVVYEN